MKQDQIQTYMKDCKLIPLHKPDAVKTTYDEEGEILEEAQLGKVPVEKWKNVIFPVRDIKDWIGKGHNVGYPVGEDELIIDMDPRNYGDTWDDEVEDSIAILLGLFEFSEVLEGMPVVKTGGGGYHIYLKLPSGVDSRSLREEVEGYPGVEFKKAGKYVVTAGSLHPDKGVEYRWVNGLRLGDRIEVLSGVVDLLKRDSGTGGGDSTAGVLSCEQLGWILDRIDVMSFHEKGDSWRSLMMGCHHATGGHALEEFVTWCVGDVSYAHREPIIRDRWHSCNPEKEDGNSVGTVMHWLLRDMSKGDAGSRDFKEISATLDFAGLGRDDDEHVELSVEDVRKELGSTLAGIEESEYQEGDAKKAAHKLRADSSAADIELVLGIARYAGPLERSQCFKIVSERTKTGVGVLKEAYVGKQDEVTGDLARGVCNLTLKETFNGGKHLVNLPSGIMYYYEGKYWHKINLDYVGRMALNVLDNIKVKMDVGGSEETIKKQAKELIKTRVSALTDELLGREAKRQKSIINCLNYEVHISADGEHELKEHRYDSYLLSVRDVMYDAHAKGILFNQTLREIFRDFPDCEDMVRHMYEILGYIMQSKKNLASFFIFKGPGGDGKSTILKVLERILGDAYVGATVSIFSMNSAHSDNHATTSWLKALALVVEELPTNVMLRDEVLKHFSENTKMECNFKGVDKIPFIWSGSLIMCTNSNPKTLDTSVGFRRRAHMIPFGRRFTEHGEADVNRAEKVTDDPMEMASAFNGMLAGLKRVRQRGGFDVPKSCKEATEAWLLQSNNMASFMEDRIEVTHDLNDSLGDVKTLYGFVYNGWCHNNNIEPHHRKSRKNFQEDLENFGLVVKKAGGNVLRVYGGRLVEEEDL